MGAEVPFASIRTIFLDVGNTLVSMDYAWIGVELGRRGIDAGVDRIYRAEAAARPVISSSIGANRSTEGQSTFALYIETLLLNLGVPAPEPSLVDELVSVLRASGSRRLWSRVLPGVPEALALLRELEIDLAVVSNSDGTVASLLESQGLRRLVGAVFDSHLVGFEKPDPRFFEHALGETGASAETTLHVGDLYAADVKGGRAAGLHTALLDPFDDWRDVDCARFTDLAALAREAERARGA